MRDEWIEHASEDCKMTASATNPISSVIFYQKHYSHLCALREYLEKAHGELLVESCMMISFEDVYRCHD